MVPASSGDRLRIDMDAELTGSTVKTKQGRFMTEIVALDRSYLPERGDRPVAYAKKSEADQRQGDRTIQFLTAEPGKRVIRFSDQSTMQVKTAGIAHIFGFVCASGHSPCLSEALLAEAQRLTRIGSFVFRLPDTTEYWSPESFQIFGIDPAKGHPRNRSEYTAYVHPDDREWFLREAMKPTLELVFKRVHTEDVQDPKGPHVDRECRTVGFGPEVTSDYSAYVAQTAKIVGVSDDLEAVAACEKRSSKS